VVPECGKAERVSRAAGEIEPAAKGVRVVLGVLQPYQARTDETCKLLRIRRFLCEYVFGTCEALKRRR